MIEVQDRDCVEMSQRERDVLKVMQGVIEGGRTQAQPARLLKRSVRQVRRIRRKLEARGDTVLVHGLRGQPSNHRHNSDLRSRVLQAYQKRYRDFGPTFACEKLAEEGLRVGVQTLRRWLLVAVSGLDDATAIRTAADDRVAVASVRWCRWTPRSTTGEGQDLRRGQRRVGEVGAGSQSTVRTAGFIPSVLHFCFSSLLTISRAPNKILVRFAPRHYTFDGISNPEGHGWLLCSPVPTGGPRCRRNNRSRPARTVRRLARRRRVRGTRSPPRVGGVPHLSPARGVGRRRGRVPGHVPRPHDPTSGRTQRAVGRGVADRRGRARCPADAPLGTPARAARNRRG
jgi:DNA-binding CsgD family transcriptional regulator